MPVFALQQRNFSTAVDSPMQSYNCSWQEDVATVSAPWGWCSWCVEIVGSRRFVLSALTSSAEGMEVALINDDAAQSHWLRIHSGEIAILPMQAGNWTFKVWPQSRPGICRCELRLRPASFYDRIKAQLTRFAKFKSNSQGLLDAGSLSKQSDLDRIKALGPTDQTAFGIWVCGAKTADLEQSLAAQSLPFHILSPNEPFDGFCAVLEPDHVLAPDALLIVAEAFKNNSVEAILGDVIHNGTYFANPAFDRLYAQSGGAYAGPVFYRTTRLAPILAHTNTQQLLEIVKNHGANAVASLPIALAHSNLALSIPSLFKPKVNAIADAPPPLTVIVPTRDQPLLLKTFLAGLLEATTYQGLEVVILDNGTIDPDALEILASIKRHTSVTVIRVDEPFNFARLINLGISTATTPLIAILNNDVEVVSSDWLRSLASHALDPEVGIVGTLLLYPDQSVQHAGIALGLHGSTGHPWRGHIWQANPRLFLPGERSAVTGACMVMRKHVFSAVGGMDEDIFPVTFNDVDLCLKVKATGLKIIYEPAGMLVHAESRSRTPDYAPENLQRRNREMMAFRQKWGHLLHSDPYYSVALKQNDESGEARLIP